MKTHVLYSVLGIGVLIAAPVFFGSLENWTLRALTGASVYLGPGNVEKQETDSSCGPAALRYLLRLHGFEVPEREIAYYAGTTEAGTSLLGLAQAASHYGFEAEAWQLDPRHANELKVPAIVYLPIRQHYVVVTEVTEERIVVADPAVGMLAFTPTEFSRAWNGVTLFVVPRTD